MQTLYVDGKYATAIDGTTIKPISFTLREKSSTVNGSNLFYVGTVPVNTTETFVFQDGVYYGTLTNVVTQSTTGAYDAVYAITTTAAEMTAITVDVIFHATDGRFRDMHIQIRTVQRLGQIDVDASQMAATTSALKLTGQATGKSISCGQDIYTAGKLETVGNLKVGTDLQIIGNLTCVNIAPTGNLAITGNITATAMTLTGALTASSISGVLTSMVLRTTTLPSQAGVTSTQVKLDASANGTNNFYNNAIVMITAGTGVGQSRVITAYTGATQLCTVNRAWQTQPASGDTFIIIPGVDVWTTSPAAQLAATDIAATPTYAIMIQALYQRFFFAHTATATLQTLYKADGTTLLVTQSLDDNGTVQTIGKAF